MMSMDTQVQVLVPTGILDSTKAEEVRTQVDSILESGTQTLLMDLKETTFVDSSGLGILVTVLKKVRARNCEMFLCSINPQIKMLFELTSMDRVFQIFENREAFEASR